MEIMRLHRFYVSTPISGTKIDISDRELVHQWKSVFRYNVGSQVVIFDGHGSDYLAIITSLRNLGATVEVIREMKNIPKPTKNIWLCVGLIKKDNFELVVQKVTELGVSHIVPVICERSEKKNLNMERLQKISVEASEQSGRPNVPKIHDIVEFTDLLDSDILPNRAVTLDLEGESIKNILAEEKLVDLVVFIGPEGGWSPKELEQFKKHNIPRISLGSQVLRAETASIAVSSLLLL